MSEFTYNKVVKSIEVFNPSGTSLGIFSGEAYEEVINFFNSDKELVVITNDSGTETGISKNCICSANVTTSTTVASFEDESVPFGCCDTTVSTAPTA